MQIVLFNNVLSALCTSTLLEKSDAISVLLSVPRTKVVRLAYFKPDSRNLDFYSTLSSWLQTKLKLKVINFGGMLGSVKSRF